MRCDHEELDEWDRKVEERLGVRLELIGCDEEPPREPWIVDRSRQRRNDTRRRVFRRLARRSWTAGRLPVSPSMNGTDPALQRGKRALKAGQAYLADLLLEEMSFVERIGADALPEDGVASTGEIYEERGLDKA